MTIPASRAALVGLATGARSVSGIAALSLFASADTGQQPDRTLGRTWVKALLGVAAVAELVGDKLPVTPSRLSPWQFGGRLAAGAAVGLILARRPSEGALSRSPARVVMEPVSARDTVATVAVAVSSAAVGTCLGAGWRGSAARRFGKDWVGAGIEDLAAVALALGGARP